MNLLAELWPIIVTWGIVIGAGALITYYALRSWHSTGERNMLALGLGIVLVSVVTGSMWFMLYFVGASLWIASLGCSAITAVGFLFVLAAVRMR